MERVHKPRFKLDDTKKRIVLQEILDYERNWKKRQKRKDFFLKTIHVGLSMVCVSVVALFLFFNWTPQNSKQTAQNNQTTQKSIEGKKTETTETIYRTDRLEQVSIMPYYDRKNDVEVKNGDITVTAIGGFLKDDKEKGVLIANFYNDKGGLARGYFVSRQKHGALTVFADGTKVRIVADDGKEWEMEFSISGSIATFAVHEKE